MKTTFRLLAIALAGFALAGCASTKLNENHKASTDAFQANQRQQAVTLQKIADTSHCGADGRCVENAKAFAALALAALGSGGGGSQVPVYVQQHHPAWGLLGAVLPAVVQGAVAVRQSDNSRDVSIAGINGQTQTMQAAFGLGSAAVASNAGAISGIAGVLPQLQPSIIAGGSIVDGDQVVTTAGRSVFGDNGHDGNTGPVNTGTQNTGGVIGSGQIGSGRQNAPGPWVGNNDGPGCVGPACQQTPPPPVEPEG